jgi:hypothetical protein
MVLGRKKQHGREAYSQQKEKLVHKTKFLGGERNLLGVCNTYL